MMLEMPTAENPIVLVCGDCREVMPSLSAGSIGAIVTDPPYGTKVPQDGYGRRQIHHGEQHILGDEDLTAMAGMLGQAKRILKRNAWVLLFCSPKRHHEACTVCVQSGLSIIGEVVWDKRQPGLGGGIRYQHETVLLCSFGKPSGRSQMPSVLRELMSNEDRLHPHEKPVLLMEDLVRYASNEGDLVLDPFAGSSSTAIAAMKTGRRCISVEKDPHYHAIAQKRVADYLSSGPLFANVEQPDLFASLNPALAPPELPDDV